MLLGHNGLSIIDLSKQANQPMVYDGLVIRHDGLVYDFLEVRRELEERGHRIWHDLRHRGDPSGLPGVGCQGSVPFALSECGGFSHLGQGEKGVVLFAPRPKFGIKPFYYIHSGDRLLFRIRICAPETVAYLQLHIPTLSKSALRLASRHWLTPEMYFILGA